MSTGIAAPNMWIAIGAFSSSTANSPQVDTQDSKAQQLLELKEKIDRDVDPSSVGGLFASGQLAMGLITATILREGSLSEVINSLSQGIIIPNISVFRNILVQGKDQRAEQIDYSNCIITNYETDMRLGKDEHQRMYTASFTFRPTKRVHTIIPFDAQTGAPGGNKVSSIDFVTVGMNAGDTPTPPPPTPGGGGNTPPPAGGGGDSGGGSGGGL